MKNNSKQGNNISSDRKAPSTFERRDGIGTNPPAQTARPGYKPNSNGNNGK